jgi:hypothetical protein
MLGGIACVGPRTRDGLADGAAACRPSRSRADAGGGRGLDDPRPSRAVRPRGKDQTAIPDRSARRREGLGAMAARKGPGRVLF